MAPPPYLEPGIDRWKLVFLVVLFVILLAGALSWYGDAPWQAPPATPGPSLTAHTSPV